MRALERRMRLALLSRWALLACLAGIAMWGAVAAAIFIERQPPAVLSVSDGLCGARAALPWLAIMARWDSSSAASADDVAHAVAVVPGEPARLMTSYHRRGILFTMPPGGVGDRVVEIQGIPYGPLAFARTSGRIVVVGPETPVYFVDSPLIHAALQADPGSVRDLMSELSRRGVVACCDKGELTPFRTLQGQLGRLAPSVLTLHADYIDTRAMAQAFLGRPDGRGTFLITAQRDMAAAAASQGIVTYLIDPAAADGGVQRLLTHPSLPELTRHLREDRLQLESLRGPGTRSAVQYSSDATSVP